MQLTTPGRVVVDRDIAGVGTRMLAQAIDIALIVAIELGVVFVGGMVSAASESFGLVVMIVAAAVVPFAYFIIPEGRGGQTPGKRALRVNVVTADGGPIGWRESVIRNIIRPIDFLPALYVLGGFVAIGSSRSQRLGDHAAGTVCVRMPEEGALASLASSAPTFSAAVEALSGAAPVAPSYPTLPPDLVGDLRIYAAREHDLHDEARQAMARGLAARLAPYHPPPEGMPVEEFVSRAAVTYAGEHAPAAAAGYPEVPPALIAVLELFRARRADLDPVRRDQLAARIVQHLEVYHPRPAGMGDDEFVTRAAATYAAGRR
jgi:uncharacterized RDD family membrane protein YckC